MAENIIYPTLEQCLAIQKKIIAISGDLAGVYPDRIGYLESTLIHIQNDNYYPDFLDKLTHLFYCICKQNHSFVNANKRTSLGVCKFFLILNNYDYVLADFMFRLEDVAVALACGNFDQIEIRNILEKVLNLEEFSEEQKLTILVSMELYQKDNSN